MTNLMGVLKNIRLQLAKPGTDAAAALDKQAEEKKAELVNGKKAASLSRDAEAALRETIAILAEESALLTREGKTGMDAFVLLKADFDKRVKAMKQQADAAGKHLSNVFTFCEQAFGDGQELLILVTELTISYYGAHFISRYGCKEYFNHNKELLFYERQKEIIAELEQLELE